MTRMIVTRQQAIDLFSCSCKRHYPQHGKAGSQSLVPNAAKTRGTSALPGRCGKCRLQEVTDYYDKLPEDLRA